MDPRATLTVVDSDAGPSSSSETSESLDDLLILFESSGQSPGRDSDDNVVDPIGPTITPVQWMTLSDTIAISPAAVPILKSLCSSFESHIIHVQSPLPPVVPCRSKSVSNLEEAKKRMSDQEIKAMRDKLLNLARNRGLFRQLERKQSLTLAIICVCYFASYCAISVMAPFFLNEAKLHHISTTTYGMIFSVHSFIMFCTSPVIGHMLPSIGPKFMFVCGVFLCGAGNLLFGVLDFIQDDTQFVVLCFIVRGMSAVGASAFTTAAATFVGNLFPDKISAVMGILETFVGLGYSIGPVIGGALYSLGGFKLPFFVLGSVMVVTLPFNMYLLPSSDHNVIPHKGPTFFKIFKIPGVLIISMVIAMSSSAWSVLEPTLVVHMKQFNLPPVQLGLLFLLTASSYAVSSPFWGWLADKYERGNLMMVTGLTVTASSLLLLGPSPIFPGVPNVIWLNIVTLILLGIFDALAFLPTYQALLHYAIDVGCDSQLSTYSIVAGLWASMHSLGEVIGPSLGGFLLDVYDFPVAMTVVAFLCLAVAALLLCYQTVMCLKKKVDSTSSSLSEKPAGVDTHQHVVKKRVAFVTACNSTGEDELLLREDEVNYGTTQDQ